MRKLLIIITMLICPYGLESKDNPHRSLSIEAGSVENGRYSNGFFKMSLAVPQKWYVLNNQEKQDLIAKQKKLVASNTSLEQSYDRSKQKTHYLLLIFQYPPGLPTKYNSSFICIAENIASHTHVKTGKDYLQFIKRIFSQTQAKAKTTIISEDMVKIGNRIFDTLSLKISLGDFSVTQSIYATLINDYALCFLFTYTNKDELRIHEDILKSIRFE